MKSSFEALELKLGYQFSNPAHLRLALTHRSHSGSSNNERLEFIGDSVLDFVIAQALYHRFPGVPEGQLSRMRSHLVSQAPLHQHALHLNIGSIMILGDGARKSGGSATPSILADALEAIFGAIVLDSGCDSAQAVILRMFESALNEVVPEVAGIDSKTQIQEYLQGKKLPLPTYELIGQTGAGHALNFTIRCSAQGKSTTATGSSRKQAEREAARMLLEQLEGA